MQTRCRQDHPSDETRKEEENIPQGKKLLCLLGCGTCLVMGVSTLAFAKAASDGVTVEIGQV